MDDDELEALFAQALESTSRKVKVKKDRTPPQDDFEFDVPTSDEDSIHIHIDESEELNDDIARLFGEPVKSQPFDDGDLVLPALGEGDDPDDSLPEADEILATLDGLDDSIDDSLDSLDDSLDSLDDSLDDSQNEMAVGDFDELDRELQAALADEDDAEEDVLQAAMERLLAESYGVKDASPGEDISLPEIPQQDGDDEILALGDDGAMSLEDVKDAEIASLRAQVTELSRSLTIKDLEIRTQEDRIEGLEQQVVAAARQSAAVGREFESFRRRVEREKEDLKKFAAEKVLKEFLVVFDNLDRAIQHAGDDRSTGLGKGVEMILGQFSTALRRCGVEEVPGGVGEPFDPQWHEAVGQEFSDSIEAGAIAGQMVAGFQLNGRLLRAAMVSVSRGPAPAPEPAEAPEPETPAEDAETQVEAEAVEPAPKKKKRTRKPTTRSKRSRKPKADAPTEEPSAEAAEANEANEAPEETEEAAAETAAGEDESNSVAASSGDDGAETDGAEEPAAPAKKKRRRRKKAPATEAEE